MMKIKTLLRLSSPFLALFFIARYLLEIALVNYKEVSNVVHYPLKEVWYSCFVLLIVFVLIFFKKKYWVLVYAVFLVVSFFGVFRFNEKEMIFGVFGLSIVFKPFLLSSLHLLMNYNQFGFTNDKKG